MDQPDIRSVIFAAAAGPRRGFGHLVRCRVLADELGVPREVILRGSERTARAARKLGWTVHDGPRVLKSRPKPSLVIVDDPSPAHAARSVRAARSFGIPTASIHDLGIAPAPADLTIDGSLACISGSVSADLQGPEFAVLDPVISEIRERRPPRDTLRVLVSLGGGSHIRAIGPTLARKLRAKAPHATVDLAMGFVPSRRAPRLPEGCQWIPGSTLTEALATATVAVVAGGLTAYQACALGTPIVAMPVVPAQRVTTRALALAGAALDASARTRKAAIDRAASHAARLLSSPVDAARLGRSARLLVDGRGASRVAARLRRLAAPSGVAHVA